MVPSTVKVPTGFLLSAIGIPRTCRCRSTYPSSLSRHRAAFLAKYTLGYRGGIDPRAFGRRDRRRRNRGLRDGQAVARAAHVRSPGLYGVDRDDEAGRGAARRWRHVRAHRVGEDEYDWRIV